MIHAFIVGLGNRQKIEKDHDHQNIEMELLAHPMFRELEEAIGMMEHQIAEAIFKHKLMLQLRRNILESFGIKEEAEPEPEAKVSEEKVEKQETESPLEKHKDLRLEILEKGVKKIIRIFKKTRMLKNSKSLKLFLKTLIEVLGKSDEPDAVRIVKMETAIGEMLRQIQSSKMASRSNVLKEVKRILEETIDTKNQVNK